MEKVKIFNGSCTELEEEINEWLKEIEGKREIVRVLESSNNYTMFVVIFHKEKI